MRLGYPAPLEPNGARRIAWMVAPDALYYTDDDEACRLLASDPFALLVGLALDQQITVQQAFAGPFRMQQRLGTLDPAAIAAAGPEKLAEVFKEKPPIHRFPGPMAGRPAPRSSPRSSRRSPRSIASPARWPDACTTSRPSSPRSTAAVQSASGRR